MINLWDKNWQKNTAFDVHPELIALIIKYAPGKKILEIGFGSAGDLEELSRKGYNCYGVETSKVAYENVRNYRKIRVLKENGTKTSFSSSSFDLIYHQGVMEHFRNPRLLLTEHQRLLKSNGVIVVDVPHKWNLFTIYKHIKIFFGDWYAGWERGYSAKELRNLIEPLGFKTLEIVYRGIWPHRWGKFLFPNLITEKKWVAKLISRFPINVIQSLIKRVYTLSSIVRLVSSHNIIIVAQKI